MGSSKKPPPPPDTSRFSDFQQDIAEEQRGWAQSMWETGQQEWGQLQQWSQDIMGMALPAMEEAYGWAKDQFDFYEQSVAPAIQSLFTEAETYASKAEEDRQRGQAVQDVNAAMDAQKEAHLRRLEGFGFDPTETRNQALDKQFGVSQAATQALAANQAGERTKQIGRDLRAQAIGVGQNMANQAMTAQQIASGIGGQNLNAATGSAVGGSQVAQGALPFMGGASTASSTGAGIVDTSYGRDLDYTQAVNAADQQDMANWAGAIGGVASLATGGLPAIAGGVMGGMAEGGPVAAPGGPADDAGAIAISDGEYVIPADVVRRLGTNHFDKMIEKETGRPPPAAKQAVPINTNSAGAYTPPQKPRMPGVI